MIEEKLEIMLNLPVPAISKFRRMEIGETRVFAGHARHVSGTATRAKVKIIQAAIFLINPRTKKMMTANVVTLLEKYPRARRKNDEKT